MKLELFIVTVTLRTALRSSPSLSCEKMAVLCLLNTASVHMCHQVLGHKKRKKGRAEVCVLTGGDGAQTGQDTEPGVGTWCVSVALLPLTSCVP